MVPPSRLEHAQSKNLFNRILHTHYRTLAAVAMNLMDFCTLDSQFKTVVRYLPIARPPGVNKLSNDKLELRFHGRIIDSLGIQMYQSPVAAIAELIANAWDADASEVNVTLPDHLGDGAEIVISDNGIGMSFQQCQECYLNVGRNRRVEDDTNKSLGGRPLLGRKGIGKFAGFGIADTVQVDTTSKLSGERTAFELHLSTLKGSSFAATNPLEIPLLARELPEEGRKGKHGTTIRLKVLKLNQTRKPESFARSMARRFLLNQSADNFAVKINGIGLPDDDSGGMDFEFDFPCDYKSDEAPADMSISDKWGIEKLADGETIRWRIRFTKSPIGTDEFRGISVYCGVKVAQTPFFFNLSGGLSGQHGQQYMSGVVKADYLDQLSSDIITTERQRINWENPIAANLEGWGQERVKQLLTIWKDRRAEEKIALLDQKIAPFSIRLNKLPPRERKVVESAIRRIAGIETLDNNQFVNLSIAILTAWEGGRLRGLIEDVSRVEEMNEGVLLTLLAEEQVLSALHVAESVKAKVGIIEGLRRRIEARELENAVRDYIAENPWLLSPEWETFAKETSVKNLVIQAAQEADLNNIDDWKKRLDLVMSSGNQLLVVEFMRPGLTVDRDHLNRFQTYIDILREKIDANTELHFRSVSGLLVADKLASPAGIKGLLDRLKQSDMRCLEWRSLLERAETQWNEFLQVLIERAPDDERLRALEDISATDEEAPDGDEGE